MSKQDLKNEIDQNINTNGLQQITGKKLNKALNDIVDFMADPNDFLPKTATAESAKGSGGVTEDNDLAVSGNVVYNNNILTNATTLALYANTCSKHNNIYNKALSVKNIGAGINLDYFDFNTKYILSGFIKVEKNTKYIISGIKVFFVNIYDSNMYKRKGVIKNEGTVTENFEITTDNTTEYIAFNITTVANESLVDMVKVFKNFNDGSEYIKCDKNTSNNLILNDKNVYLRNWISGNGDLLDTSLDRRTTTKIDVSKISKLFIKNIPTEVRKAYLFTSAKGDIVYNANYQSESLRLLIPRDAKYFQIYYKAESENADNLTISYINDYIPREVSDNVNISNYKEALIYSNNNTLVGVTEEKEYTLPNTSEQDIITILHLNKNEVTENNNLSFINCSDDFKNIDFVYNDTICDKKVFSGHYSLTKADNYKEIVCQNTEGDVIGWDRGTNSIYISSDNGISWAEIIQNSYLVSITPNNDILTKEGEYLKIYRMSDNYSIGTEIFNFRYTSSFVSSHNITYDNLGNMYLGCNQEEYDVKVYKTPLNSIDFKQIYSNTYKQHVHRLWFDNTTNRLFVNIDGATSVFDNGEFGNSGMTTIYSEDYGVTFNRVVFPFTTDYGINSKCGEWYFGSAEGVIKNSPSLFRTKDLKNFETLIEMPLNTQSVRVISNYLVVSVVAYSTYNYPLILISDDYGDSFTPIFDDKFQDSLRMQNGYRYGTISNSVMTDTEGDYLILATGVDNLKPLKLRVGKEYKQALCYIRTRGKEKNNNTLNVKSSPLSSENKEFEIKDNSIFYLKFGKENINTPINTAIYPLNTIISNGSFKDKYFPFKLDEYVSANIKDVINIDVKMTCKTIRFGYKTNGVYSTEVFNILTSKDVKILSLGNSLLVYINGVEYKFNSCFNNYFSKSTQYVTLTFINGSLYLFVNNYKISSVTSNYNDFNIEGIELGNMRDGDYLSSIYFYDNIFYQKTVNYMFDKGYIM